MFRESATPGSKHVFALVSAERGLALQYRSETGGQSASAGGATGAAPVWLRLTRRNNTFTAESSFDGRSWTTYGSVTVQMGGTVLVGIGHTTGYWVALTVLWLTVGMPQMPKTQSA